MENRRLTILRVIAILFTIHYSLFTATAQDSIPQLRFGHLSYQQALEAMPAYAIVQKEMADLRAQYAAEMKRVEDEFNRKYEDFLDGQREFPKTILRKRQTELQELMTRNIAFKQESLQQLANTEKEKTAPLRELLRQAIATVAATQQLAFVINTDADACPYINPAVGTDISEQVNKLLAK